MTHRRASVRGLLLAQVVRDAVAVVLDVPDEPAPAVDGRPGMLRPHLERRSARAPRARSPVLRRPRGSRSPARRGLRLGGRPPPAQTGWGVKVGCSARVISRSARRSSSGVGFPQYQNPHQTLRIGERVEGERHRQERPVLGVGELEEVELLGHTRSASERNGKSAPSPARKAPFTYGSSVVIDDDLAVLALDLVLHRRRGRGLEPAPWDTTSPRTNANRNGPSSADRAQRHRLSPSGSGA